MRRSSQAFPQFHKHRNSNRKPETLVKLCEEERHEEAIEIIQQSNFPLNRNNVYYLLQACEKTKDLKCGKEVQSFMIHKGLDSISVLGDHLTRLFTYHLKLFESNQAFNNISKPSVYSWSGIILANAKLGQEKMALSLYHRMQHYNIDRDKHVYVAVLHACTVMEDVWQGISIHHTIIKEGLQSDIFIATSLIDMYVKCGSLQEACIVFRTLKVWSVVPCNAMIAGFLYHGKGVCSFYIFHMMQHEGIIPDEATFMGVLKACASSGTIGEGRLIHSQIKISGFFMCSSLRNSLLDMYAKSGGLLEAYSIFMELPKHDVVTWAIMVAGFAQHGQGLLALDLYEKMQKEGVDPDAIIFLSVLKACTSARSILHGRAIHNQIISKNMQSDIIVGNTLVDMYAKCGSIEEACKIFWKLENRNVVSWNTMISAYAQLGQGICAFECFEDMDQQGIGPDGVTFLGLLKACNDTGALQQGRAVHDQMIEGRLESDAIIGNGLVEMYAKCDSLEEAHRIFENLQVKNLTSWNAALARFVHHAEGLLALGCFKRMQQEGIAPDEITFLSVTKACTIMCAIEEGRLIHNQIIKECFHSDICVGNSLIDMYIKCGSLAEAGKVFNELLTRDIISWNAMIAGYALSGEHHLAEEYYEKMKKEGIQPNVISWNGKIAGYAECGKSMLALQCFDKMRMEGIRPNEITYSSTLRACASMGSILRGRQVHDDLIVTGFRSGTAIDTALVDMYAKCGSLEDAQVIFSNMQTYNVVSWNAMLAGFALHGMVVLALNCFGRMQESGISPDDASFTSVLVVCSRVGLVDEGRWYFRYMRECHGIAAVTSHCNCIIDLLGRAGCLEEAERLLGTAFPTNILGWVALLSASRNHANTELGRRCFDEIVLLNSSCAAGYILMSNIYLDAFILTGSNENKHIGG